MTRRNSAPDVVANVEPATLHSVRGRSLYVTPIRLLLGVAWLVAGRAAGAPATAAVLAFVGGAALTCFTLLNDPRARFRAQLEPQPVPADVSIASPVRQALAATIPSTLGVSVLAALALAAQPTLTAVLGGISAGLGVAGALSALATDPDLLFDPRRKALYRRSR